MFAVAFDLEVAAADEAHPKSVRQAYLDLESALGRFGFRRVQGSVFVTDEEDMANLFRALSSIRDMPWAAAAIRDIRAFRVEQWSDFTPVIKNGF